MWVTATMEIMEEDLIIETAMHIDMPTSSSISMLMRSSASSRKSSADITGSFASASRRSLTGASMKCTSSISSISTMRRCISISNTIK